MDDPQVIFNKVVGAIVAISIAKEYCGYMSVVYAERKDNYMVNKFAEVEKGHDKLMKAMSIKTDAMIPEIKEIIEFNMSLIFDIVALDPTAQKRIYNLVQKIQKEEKSKNK